jgi:hypothetical protein
MLHKILTAVTALAVVASLLAGTAGQAAAVTGYDSAYFGESAFLTLGPGQSGQFAVGFNNTGSTGWLTGSASQVDLAVCLPDKTTCNTTSPNAAFASAWLSSTAYATTSTTYVGPGQTGYFVYNVTVPAGSAPGTYRFNGDVALHGTASTLHAQGYYQDVQVPSIGAAAKLACTAAPTSIEMGSTTTSTITVTVQDSSGNTVTTDNTNVIRLAQGGATGSSLNGGAADASATKTTTAGVSTFTLDASAATATGTDQLSATSDTFPTLTGCLVNVTIAVPGAATALKETLTPSAFPAGSASFATATATLIDAAGVATTSTTDTTVTFTASDITICNFAGAATTTQPILATTSSTTGTANVTVTGVPGSCIVTVSASGLTSASKTLTVTTAGPASKLVVTANTCNPSAINTACDVTVQAQDAGGNVSFAAILVTATTDCLGTTTGTGAQTTSGGSTVFALTDTKAESCTATFAASGLSSATAPLQFTGFGTADHLKVTVSPTSIPANGVSTTTATVCVVDLAGNKVTTATDQVFLSRTGTANTLIISADPSSASSGCATFTVRSSTSVGTDTFSAQDLTRTLPGTNTTAILTTTTP